MIIATFGDSTSWKGLSITYEEGEFALEGQGSITIWNVLEHDRQGHLRWAYAGLREWVYGLSGQSAPPASGTTPAAAESEASPESRADANEALASDRAPTRPWSDSMQPQTAPERPSLPGGRRRARLVVILIAACLVAPLILAPVAGGGLREAAGFDLTVLGVALIVLLLTAALRPQGVRRRLAGHGLLRVMAVAGVMCAVCLPLAGVLWWMPHFEVVAPADKRIVLDGSPSMTVNVVNHGLWGGTYTAVYAVNGIDQRMMRVKLGPGESEAIRLALPSDTWRGPVRLFLGDHELLAQAVLPPKYVVAHLQVDPPVAERGQTVTISTTVENTGDVAGTFDGVLQANGYQVAAHPVRLAPGEIGTLAYTLNDVSPGRCRLKVGGTRRTLVVVRPVRLRNGYVIRRNGSGGRSGLRIINPTSYDAMVVLTRAGNLRKSVLAVYVRKRSKAQVGSIPDGKYVLWNSIGSDWNWYTRDFYNAEEHKRWRSGLSFSTTSSTRYWTTRWSDAYYIYSQGHSQTTVYWHDWTITLGEGPSRYTRIVSARTFPAL